METEELNEMNQWVNKYRPTKLDDIIMKAELKSYFKNLIAAKKMINCCFAGSAGLGKTTTALAIANELGAEVLFVKCAVNGTVDYCKTTIQPFCEAKSIDGSPKVVILDEIDSASGTQDNSCQKSLRNLIEMTTDTIFIMTCNYPSKVIPPLKSRCPIFDLSFDKLDLLKRIKLILDSEKIKYGKQELGAYATFAFKFYPDIRRMIGILEGACASGTLNVDGIASTDTEQDVFLKSVIDECNKSKLLDVRKFVMHSKTQFNNDYQQLAENLFNYMLDNGLVEDRNAILKLVDTIYMMNQTINKEITFTKFLSLICKNG